MNKNGNKRPFRKSLLSPFVLMYFVYLRTLPLVHQDMTTRNIDGLRLRSIHNKRVLIIQRWFGIRVKQLKWQNNIYVMMMEWLWDDDVWCKFETLKLNFMYSQFMSVNMNIQFNNEYYGGLYNRNIRWIEDDRLYYSFKN